MCVKQRLGSIEMSKKLIFIISFLTFCLALIIGHLFYTSAAWYEVIDGLIQFEVMLRNVIRYIVTLLTFICLAQFTINPLHRKSLK